jgi:hypothetical protein
VLRPTPRSPTPAPNRPKIKTTEMIHLKVQNASTRKLARNCPRITASAASALHPSAVAKYWRSVAGGMRPPNRKAQRCKNDRCWFAPPPRAQPPGRLRRGHFFPGGRSYPFSSGKNRTLDGRSHRPTSDESATGRTRKRADRRRAESGEVALCAPRADLPDVRWVPQSVFRPFRRRTGAQPNAEKRGAS